MAATREMAIGDLVELTKPSGAALAGATGGVVAMLDDGRVMVELTESPPEPVVDRVVVVARDDLRSLPRVPGR
jgi:hypothetical protein